MAERTRNVCFTSWDALQLDPQVWPHCTYATWQLELSPTTNKLHWQGYAEFDVAVSWSSLHHLDGFSNPPAHFEARRGTQKQAVAYAQKEASRVEGPWTYGEPKHQGQQTAILDAVTAIRSGSSMKDLAESHPIEVVRYSSGLTKVHHLLSKPRPHDVKTVCFVFYGAGGTGKSSFALRLANYLGPRIYRVPSAKGSGLYWDGYSQGDVVIIDEFKGNRMQPTEFNMLIDSGPHQVPIHGGTTEFNSAYVIITTNVSPKNWWEIEFLKSLRRRIVLFPIFRNLSFQRPKPQLCPHCASSKNCAFHHE